MGQITICRWPYLVAPFTGAWIEILNLRNDFRRELSLPSRERGLKFLKRHVPCT